MTPRKQKLARLAFCIASLFLFLSFAFFAFIWLQSPQIRRDIWHAPSSPQYFDVDGIGKVAYWRVDSIAPNPNPVPILFLEGGPGIGISRLTVVEIAREFPDFTIYFLDQLGVGQSGRLPLDLVTLENSVEVIEQFSSKVTREPALVVGGSWGAAIAARFATQHPSHVKALLLSSPAPMPSVCEAASDARMGPCFETRLPDIDTSASQYPIARAATASVPDATIIPDQQTNIPNGRYFPHLNRLWLVNRIETFSPTLAAWLVPYQTRGKWDTGGINVEVNRRLQRLHTATSITSNTNAAEIPTLILRGDLDYIDITRTGGYQILFPNSRFVALKNETHALNVRSCAVIMETRTFLAQAVGAPKPKLCTNQLTPTLEFKGGYTLEAKIQF